MTYKKDIEDRLISDTEKTLRERTKAYSIGEGSLWGIFWGFGESYLIPYAIFLGASSSVIAYVSTAPILVMALAQLIGALLLDYTGRRRPIISCGFFTQGFAFIPLLFLPRMTDPLRIVLFLCMITLAFFSVGIARPSWVSLMGDVVETDRRGAYFSQRERIMMSAMVLATLIAGGILQLHKNTETTAFGFTLIIGIALIARIAGAALIGRHYEAPFDAITPETENTSETVWQSFYANPNFLRFTIAMASLNGMFNIAAPFFAVRMLKDLQWSYMQFTLSMVIFMASQTLFIRWWGTLSDRHGNRSVMRAASGLLAPFLLIWICTENTILLLLSQILSGAAWSGLNLSASNFIYDAVGQRGRAKAFSFYSFACGLFSVTGGVLIGARLMNMLPSEIRISESRLGMGSPIPLLFSITALGCILVRLFLFNRFSEVRTAEPVTTFGILLQLITGKPFRDRLSSLTHNWRKKNR